MQTWLKNKAMGVITVDEWMNPRHLKIEVRDALGQ